MATEAEKQRMREAGAAWWQSYQAEQAARRLLSPRWKVCPLRYLCGAGGPGDYRFYLYDSERNTAEAVRTGIEGYHDGIWDVYQITLHPFVLDSPVVYEPGLYVWDWATGFVECDTWRALNDAWNGIM